MSKRSAILSSALVMLTAVVLVLWLVSGGEATLPSGVTTDRVRAEQSAGLAAGLEGAKAQLAGTTFAADRSAVLGEGEFDPAVLAALCGFTGRVVDFQNQPVADCGVRIFRGAMDSIIRPGVSLMSDVQMEPDYLAGEEQTSSDGVFMITGVWPRGMYLLYAGIGTDNPTHVIVRETPGPGEIVDLGDIKLKNGAVITGVVVDENYEPVSGALVRGVDLPGQLLGMIPIERFDPEGAVLIREEQAPVQVVAMPPWVSRVIEDLPIPSTHTDLEGHFRLVGLTPGANMMAVTKLGYLSDIKPRLLLKAGEERDVGRIRLREGEEIYGQVVDTSGEPVVGAEVVAAPTTQIAPIDFGSFVGPTDAEGRFQASGFPRGLVTVAARRSPGQHWVLAEPQFIDSDLILQLPGSFDLTVALVSKLGIAIESPAFRLIPAENGEGATEMAMLGFVRSVDLDGKLEQLEDGRHRITDLSEGQYTLLVTSPGHGVAVAGVALQSDEELTVDLDSQTHYSVRVTDLEGVPIRSAQIYALGSGRGRNVDFPLHCGYTNAAGRLAIDQVSGNQIRLTAKHPAYGMAHARGSLGSGEITIVLSPPGTVEGELTEKGRPPELGKWSVIAVQNGRGGVSGALEDVPQFAVPNLEGVFHFSDLQPGQFTLQAVQSMDLLNSPGSVYTFAMTVMMEGQAPPQDVEVISGTITRVHIETSQTEILDGPGARITGMLMVNGRPATGMSVQIFGQNVRKVSKVDETGLFDLGYVEEGKIQLMVIDLESGDMFSGGPTNLWSERLEIVANQDQHLNIDLQTTSLSGSVRNPQGDPIPLASVRLTGRVVREAASGAEPTLVNFRTQTDMQGRFEFVKLPAGEYSVQVEANEGAQRTSRAGITVMGSLPITDLHLITVQTHYVRGRVDLSVFGGEKPQRLRLNFTQLPAGPQRSGRLALISGGGSVADDGSFEVNNLLPGSYTVILSYRGGNPLEHEGAIEVGSADLEGILIQPVRKDGR